MKRIEKLHSLGQSIWYDNIQRRLLENGEMEELIRRGDIRGVTSNPSIFNNAIAKTNDYDAALKPMAWAGWTADQIFEQLALEDIRAAADLFRPLFDETKGGDGFVSIEVNPTMAHDAEKTASEAKRLWALVNRPNVMVKIPATLEGLPAIRKSIAAGININITLIFSLALYSAVIEAYLSGLEDRLAQGLPIGTIASVASFFVSRVDTKVDGRLEAIIKNEGPDAEKASRLLGKAAIANAKMALCTVQPEPQHGALQEVSAPGSPDAAPFVGFDQHKESSLPGCHLCRRVNWQSHHQHDASANPGCLPRSWRSQIDPCRRADPGQAGTGGDRSRWVSRWIL